MRRSQQFCLAAKATLIVLMSLAFIVACAPEEEEVAAPPDDPDEDRIGVHPEGEEYIFVSSAGNLEFFNAHRYGWKIAGEYLGVETEYMSRAEFDVAGQFEDFEAAIARDPAGIALWGHDPALDPVINRAVELGIPVVSVIGDQPGSDRHGYVGSRQYDLGYLGGQALGEEMGGSGKVGILTLPGVEMFDQREEGFRAAIEEHYPDIEIVGRADTQADTAVGIDAASAMLSREPDLEGFFNTDSVGAMASATVVEEAGLVGDIHIIGMDRNSDVLTKIEEGVISGTIAQNDVTMSLWALLKLYTYNHFQPPLTADNEAAGVSILPEEIIVPPNYVDQDNLQYFLEANEMYTDF